MGFIIMTLCGIGLAIAKANAWLIVPDWCIWVCCGIAAAFALVSVINYFGAKKMLGKANKRFR